LRTEAKDKGQKASAVVWLEALSLRLQFWLWLYCYIDAFTPCPSVRV